MKKYEKFNFIPKTYLTVDNLNYLDQGIADANEMAPATYSTLGGIIPGRGLTTDSEGRLNVIGDMNFDNLETIHAIVQAGQGPEFFKIGDQLIIPWKDMDDASHNTDKTAYQVAWNIVHHENVELQDGRIVPGMFIQMDKCSAYGVQFSHQQAFLNCQGGLVAGTYHLTLSTNWGANAVAGTTWQFTLTQDVPAGGRLSGFEGMPDQANTNWRVKSWANATNAEPIETVVVTSGGEGADLGMMPYNAVGENGLNGMQQVAYGHNRWSTSAIRQYLNSSGASWYKNMENFDIRPNQYNKRGFMTGFDAEFLSIIKPVKVTTALNTVEGFAEATEDTFDTFFLPSLEQINAKPQLKGVEGDYFEYWRRRMGLNGFINYSWEAEPNKSTALLIPAINANSAQYVRLRSAFRGNARYTWGVYSSGYVDGNSASNAYRFSPVCVIC